jgi:hypothetical protein
MDLSRGLGDVYKRQPHKWGSGGGGSSQAQIFKVKPLDNP